VYKHVASVFVYFEVGRCIPLPADAIAICITGVLCAADCGKSLHTHLAQMMSCWLSSVNWCKEIWFHNPTRPVSAVGF